jgi:hypothetical protein
MPLTSKLKVSVDAKLTQTLDLAEGTVPMLKEYAAALATGIGAGQADKVWHDQRTLALSTGEDIDLAGTLVDAFGNALTFVKVKGLLVSAAATNANNVVVGNAATNGFVSWVGGATHTVTVRPGATLALFCGQADAAGYAVTAGTADLLRILNGGAGSSVTYDIIIIGTSA